MTLTWEDLRVPAGATVILITVLTQQSRRSDAAWILAPLTSLAGTAAIAWVDDEELVSIHNFPLEPGVFEGTTLVFGVNAGGTFILPALDYGLRRTGDEDWLIDATPWEAWALESSRFSFINHTPDEDDELPMYLTARSATAPTFAITQVTGSPDVEVLQTMTHEDGSDAIRIDVELTNLTPSDLTDLMYLRVVDPDPDFSLGTSDTANDLVDGTDGVVLTARGNVSGRTIAMATEEDGVVAAVIAAPWPTDPGTVIAAAGDPEGTPSDSAMYFVWDLGDLAAGTSIELR